MLDGLTVMDEFAQRVPDRSRATVTDGVAC
jgi:hypothetical protein